MHGVGPQHVRVKDSECDGGEADAHTQRKDGGCEESRVVPQRSRTVAEILDALLEPHPPAGFVEALFDERDVAKCLSSFRFGTIAAPSLAHEAIGFDIKVGLNFSREVLVRAASTKERHHPFSGSGPRTRDIAAARRRHFVDSWTS